MIPDDVKPLTREEVRAWPALGPMNLDPWRVWVLFDEIDRLKGLIKGVESDGVDTMYGEVQNQCCLWCGVEVEFWDYKNLVPGGAPYCRRPHRDDCKAFLPDGTVR